MQSEGVWADGSPLVLPSAAATQALAALIGQMAEPGLVILLEGNLGSGKTTFVQGLGQGLGIPEPIDSPTFVLLQEYYTGRIPLFHCDLYRLESASAEDLGLEELWNNEGITAIEWPQHLSDLPSTYLWLHLQSDPQIDEFRFLHIKGKGSLTAQLWQQVHSVFSQIPQQKN
ncbi:tRNA (adenosine(37)-N6)-threonylcarbamoyltransferase complex ATPase subunit type 1 TsaE [Thermostichus vulcanus]|uniref:tRNA threonylcarbamoyladenosine biosynthesis protein TsaE n=1 Tax=Thermostichus vulcanus str. 'Rupite' TaxID=2813851 RepID=A0ABT0CE30_THEVL|nr:tRNA (adenosine(37)-N6)-threonylcarbamoyltransferase complex ATPase subunit type 1 TsaE [Thermostichus vulcanus]MCJ2544043.1 tRNA (adenosine(37)-N6)-threonylcarbamoyltransferase complex ATPase subunit type 1 TsaE [Thermostichus vulcanus str. 'Rupite']